jgi:hypothetical protein
VEIPKNLHKVCKIYADEVTNWSGLEPFENEWLINKFEEFGMHLINLMKREIDEVHTCHDCGVREGEIHQMGCDMERCPFCGRQLISCDCIYKKLELFDYEKYPNTHGLHPDIYNHGPTNDQWMEWLSMLYQVGRVPYIVYPNICRRCGELWPEMFMVPDEEWEHYIEKQYRKDMLCWDCYSKIKQMIDEASPEKAIKSRPRFI